MSRARARSHQPSPSLFDKTTAQHKHFRRLLRPSWTVQHQPKRNPWPRKTTPPMPTKRRHLSSGLLGSHLPKKPLLERAKLGPARVVRPDELQRPGSNGLLQSVQRPCRNGHGGPHLRLNSSVQRSEEETNLHGTPVTPRKPKNQTRTRQTSTPSRPPSPSSSSSSLPLPACCSSPPPRCPSSRAST